MVDGVDIPVQPNENGHFRGLHIVVINPINGKVSKAQSFDTHESSVAMGKFVADLEQDWIIVVACKDTCVKAMDENIVYWLANLGSREVFKLKPNQGFVFIGISGRNEIMNEKRANKSTEAVSATQVFVVNANSEAAADEFSKQSFFEKGQTGPKKLNFV